VRRDMVDLDAIALGRALRRTRIVSVLLGVLALAVAAAVGHADVGLGIAVGLALGALNTRWVDNSVARVRDVSGAKAARRPIALRTLGRLAVSTAAVVALLLLATPVGFGTLAGLVLYQVAFLASMLRAVMTGGATG
jgi:hypothetical protein